MVTGKFTGCMKIFRYFPNALSLRLQSKGKPWLSINHLIIDICKDNYTANKIPIINSPLSIIN